jgi:hypothetical protein
MSEDDVSIPDIFSNRDPIPHIAIDIYLTQVIHAPLFSPKVICQAGSKD